MKALSFQSGREGGREGVLKMSLYRVNKNDKICMMKSVYIYLATC